MNPKHVESLLIGESAVMRQLRTQIARVAPSRISVLIEGPTGSGKELVANALHAKSERTGPLVAVNVCAIADTMFEDSMFGHVRGSFSGAIADHTGHLLEAHRGTVFLDEIGGLQLGAQVKLLRALETREFRPVGARTDRSSDFRLIAATNVPLARAIAAGSFRADLGFRLSGLVIRVPALGEHPEDIPDMARHFAEVASQQRGITVDLSDAALAKLAGSAWSGNARQLRQVVECAVAFASTSRVGAEEITELIQSSADNTSDNRSSFERRRLLDTLRACDWDMDRTAESLDVHRASIYRRLRRLGIDLRHERAGNSREVSAPRDRAGVESLAPEASRPMERA
jgi:DNA-binding NtrC family response regulator